MAQRILIINDDQDILDLYRMLLEDEGYTVFLSKFVFEHPADVARLDPALVILDLKFQKQIQGWMMLQKLRMYRPTSEIPLIVCTAAVREAQEQEAYLLTQHVPVVYKPFNIDRFLSVVNDSLCVPATD